MLMPKTSINENHFFLASEYKIWLARHFFVMEPVTVTKGVDKLSNHHFRFHVLAADFSHILAALMGQ